MDASDLHLSTVPGDIVLFKDPHPQSPRREHFNQVGVVLPDGVVTYIRLYEAVEMKFSELTQLDLAVHRFKDEELTQKVAKFFSKYRRQARFVALGLAAVHAENYGVFDPIGIMPVFRSIPNQEEYDAAWERVVSKLEPGDLVCVFEHKSVADWLIRRLDRGGAWSHAATYIGNGMIIEAVPRKGMIIRNLDIYKSRYIRLGIYRDPSLTAEMVAKGLKYIQDLIEPKSKIVATIGRPIQSMMKEIERRLPRPIRYDLRGAVALGIRKVLAGLRYGDGAYFVSGMTPNDLVFEGRLRLVDYV